MPDKTILLGSNAGCQFENLKLPKNTLIYATGAYKGRELESYIDKSNHNATQFDIVINSPQNPVALILAAYEPSVWNIGWTKNTQTLAIVATGNHRQAVVGMTASMSCDGFECPRLSQETKESGPIKPGEIKWKN